MNQVAARMPGCLAASLGMRCRGYHFVSFEFIDWHCSHAGGQVHCTFTLWIWYVLACVLGTIQIALEMSWPRHSSHNSPRSLSHKKLNNWRYNNRGPLKKEGHLYFSVYFPSDKTGLFQSSSQKESWKRVIPKTQWLIEILRTESTGYLAFEGNVGKSIISTANGMLHVLVCLFDGVYLFR